MTELPTDGALITADSVARFAGLLADRSRMVMCLALLDGRAWTSGELAAAAHVSASTASGHLSLLVEAGLLAEERQGRHRYLRLAGPVVGQLLEDLAALVGEAHRPSSLRAVRAAGKLAYARTCYDHLAGRLGVAIFDALVEQDLLSVVDGLRITDQGRTWFAAFIGADAIRVGGPRPLLRTCLDWTERRSHLAGTLGTELHRQLRQLGWLRPGAERRAVTVTSEGRAGLHELLGIDLDARAGATA